MADPNEVIDTRIRRALHQFVLPALESRTTALDEVAAHHVLGEPIPYPDAATASYEPFPVGDPWGPAWSTTWFRLRGRIPSAWAGEEVALAFVIGRAGATGFGAEAQVWDGGRPMQGISPNHRRYRLTKTASGRERVDLYVEAAANPRPPFGSTTWPLLMPDPDGPPLFRLSRAELVVVQRDLGDFAHDFRVLVELLGNLPPDAPRAARVRRHLNAACNALDLADIAGSFRTAWPELRDALDAPAAPRTHVVHASGHAHLDTAWLWPLRETVRKCARTFSTAVHLMDDHPEYTFACSQAQHLAWMKERYPDLYERISAKVATGQFEPTGSMWVEPDCNIPNGESLVRQIVYGKRFYLDEFGVETRDMWLPDVFGYSAALPQIMKRAGIDWFLTQKLSWNQYDDLPHHSFTWEGIDGSRVFTHFPPAETYNGDGSVEQLRFGMQNFRDHAIADRSLYPFGWGDGGGGPTEEILASLHRARDLDGLPKVEFSGPRAFFEAAEHETDEWPVWSGELYFECHRGTYTTQAAAKLGNRRGEGALRDAELWAAAAADPSVAYPGQELEAAWKLLLLHQFHDIIPGSGIHWVYDDTARDHAAVAATAGGIIDAATSRIAAEIDTSASEHPLVVFNPASHDRTELVSGPDGTPLAHVTVPACGYTVLDVAADAEPGDVAGGTAAAATDAADRQVGPVTVASDRIENEHLRVEFDADGLIVSLLDKDAAREVIEPGARGNRFQLHPDYPNFYDAWDIDRFAFETVTDLSGLDSVTVVEAGPLRAALRFTRSFGGSTISQVVSLASGARRLVFTTDVDWQECNRLLKVAFPVAVRSSRATYEIQFGQIERPTHENTTWDAARFEVCAQQWADLSEPGYGVALLNDCKYGYDIHGNVMRLSLLRAPSWPDPVADRGAHRFTYALLPHRGDVAEGRVVEEARELNQPLRLVRETRHGGSRPPTASLVRVHGLPLQVSAVKQADRARGTVVRLVEVHGRRGTARLALWAPIARAVRCDLLERDQAAVAVDDDGTVDLPVGPFEIVSLRLELR